MKRDGPVPAIVCEVCREEHGGRCPLEPRGTAVLAALLLLLASCGGGGGGPAPAQRECLTWRPPGAFTDNSTLDPARDLDRYEVYVSRDGNWDNEVPVAEVAAVDSAGRIAEEFEIGLLRQLGINPTDNGQLVTVRAVSVHDKASAYAEPAFWEER